MLIRCLMTCLLIAHGATATIAQNAKTADERAWLALVLNDELMSVAAFEVGARENLRRGPDGSIGFGVLRGQPLVRNGMRAEISVDPPFRPGDTITYAQRFRLPDDFTADTPRNRWTLMAQFSDQPDRRKGETWDSFASHSPAISLALGELDGRLGFVMRYGVTHIAAPQQRSAPIFFERDQWYEMRMVVQWSQEASGSARLYMNNDVVADFDGPNMNNAAPHYLKLGLYRHPEIAVDQWIFIDDIRVIGPS